MTIILAHGLGQKGTSWHEVQSFLELDQAVMCPELMELTVGRTLTYQHLYQKFSEYCNQFEGKLKVCGLSLGAVLALNYAVDHPGKVHHLILVAPQYKMPNNLFAIQNGVFRLLPAKLFLKNGFQKSDILSLTRSMKGLNFEAKLGNLVGAVTICYGSKDIFNKKAAQKLFNKINQSQLLAVPKAGHEMNVDSPKELAEIIKSMNPKPPKGI